jgi:uncharacterized protein YyaL (SSP411 family)
VNRLAGETSPYLLQHAANPVDWYPFGEEALSEAARSDRPLFVSVGYSACHWCHVMAHESFEDETTAAYLNERFVSVKVDREERPDVDAVYMEAVQATSGHGGWPMTVFCTPDGRPFFGGTYFPSDPHRGRPTFRQLLEAIAGAWAARRGDLLAQADDLSGAVARRLSLPGASGAGEGRPSPARVASSLSGAAERLAGIFDGEHGGFGSAPKFPQAPLLELLLRAHVAGVATARRGRTSAPLAMVTRTLGAMARGGIYDHLGGGFARYSVDRRWVVPHFEKMLYDQAALARAYLHAWQLDGNPEWRQVLGETVGYVLDVLTTPDGGVHAAEDADSEGEEGRFYVWTRAQLDEVLGTDAGALAADWYGVTEAGNFEGRNILLRPDGGPLARPAPVEDARRALHEARSRRVPPGRDDKILTEWNAMWCSTLAEAAGVAQAAGWPEAERWSAAALANAQFLLASLRRADGRWLRSFKDGRAAHLAYAADYAWLVEAFTRCAELTGRTAWLTEASLAADALVDLFLDPDAGLFTTGRDAPSLVVRPREITDGVIPSAAAVAATALCRLGALTGDETRADVAARIVATAGDLPDRAPTAVPQLLAACELLAGGTVEVVVAGRRRDLVDEARRRFVPSLVLAWGDVRGPFAEGRSDGRGYVCRAGACRLPSDDAAALAAELAAVAPPP